MCLPVVDMCRMWHGAYYRQGIACQGAVSWVSQGEPRILPRREARETLTYCETAVPCVRASRLRAQHEVRHVFSMDDRRHFPTVAITMAELPGTAGGSGDPVIDAGRLVAFAMVQDRASRPCTLALICEKASLLKLLRLFPGRIFTALDLLCLSGRLPIRRCRSRWSYRQRRRGGASVAFSILGGPCRRAGPVRACVSDA